ncbi:hypothetical protein FRC20_001645 [Serendipita sp. 405]|nr:hypothetical protein FRC20_001645 [Serendipita sp. 405]
MNAETEPEHEEAGVDAELEPEPEHEEADVEEVGEEDAADQSPASPAVEDHDQGDDLEEAVALLEGPNAPLDLFSPGYKGEVHNPEEISASPLPEKAVKEIGDIPDD